MWRVEWRGRWACWVWEAETSTPSVPATPPEPAGAHTKRARRSKPRRRGEIEAQARADLARCALDPGEVESIAEKAIADAEMDTLWFPLTELLAIRLKFFVCSEPGLAGCGHEGLLPEVLTVRSSKDW